MNKGEFIEEIAETCDTTKSEAERLVNAVLSTITDKLKNGEQIAFPGFGTFSVGMRAARTGRNPQTGEPLEIKAARVAKFKAGKGLKDAMQAGMVEES